jgi:hypothetical protein
VRQNNDRMLFRARALEPLMGFLTRHSI